MKSYPMHLLIPMSGQGTRYQKAGYREPKPLIPVSGKPMLERLLQVFPTDWPTTFVIADNHKTTALPATLKGLRPEAHIAAVPQHEKGPSWAVLEGLQHIPAEAPVLVSYCDYGMVWDPRHFDEFTRNSECDGCLVSYRGFHGHYVNPQTYAFSKLDGEQVTEVREKGGFTDNRETEFASCGAYYFRSAKLLREVIDFQMQHNIQLHGEFYTSLTMQALLQLYPRANVRVYEIPYFYQWGTPADLRAFEYWEKSMRTALKPRPEDFKAAQVLMPMAGKGSRFGGISPRPKPFLRMGDGAHAHMMFECALATLPRGKTSIVALADAAPFLRESSVGPFTTELLQETPPGQAFSVEAGLGLLQREEEVIVSSCDHGIALDAKVWRQFKAAPRCDAAIFTMQGFPGADRKPKAFAYVVPKSSEPFPEVASVSVKVPVSPTPSQDHVLVGTFWFASGQILADGLKQLKSLDVRVNGELYLDSIFEVLQGAGKVVRMIPLDGYLCWGDPEAMAETLYWQEVFGARRWDIRKRLPGVS